MTNLFSHKSLLLSSICALSSISLRKKARKFTFLIGLLLVCGIGGRRDQYENMIEDVIRKYGLPRN